MWQGRPDEVTARALAPLKALFDQSLALMRPGALGVFPKGQDVEAELTEAAKYWRIEAAKVPSKTSPDGCVVRVTGLHRLRGADARP
jgi:16S rRNA (guanine527-N7)-methyltransferase